MAGVAPYRGIAIGHSNGCHIINTSLARHEAPFSQVIYIAPALDTDTPLPPQVQRCLVIWSDTDWPTKIARWIPFSGWGAMGSKGYQGPKDNRIQSVRIEDWLPAEFEQGDGIGHSGYFQEPFLLYVRKLILAWLKDA